MSKQKDDKLIKLLESIDSSLLKIVDTVDSNKPKIDSLVVYVKKVLKKEGVRNAAIDFYKALTRKDSDDI